MYVSQTLKTMHSELTDQFPNRSTYPNEQHYERYSSLKVYSYAEDIEQLVSYGKVLSVVYLSLNSNKPKFYICQRSQHANKCILFKIDFLDETGFNKCGIWYAPIEICVVIILAMKCLKKKLMNHRKYMEYYVHAFQVIFISNTHILLFVATGNTEENMTYCHFLTFQ